MVRLTLLFTLFVIFATTTVAPSTAHALSGSEFQAGRIIDDAVFFNGSAISAQDIQLFLNSKVAVCDTNGQQMRGNMTRAAYGASQGYPAPYTCLKDYRETIPTKVAESGLCNGLSSGNRSAAEIIYEVGRTCGVNQAVLIVLLQKEQTLITDDWPWSIQYRSATGYGCPDTAPCDAEYYGFFNQVYNAARQYKKYARDESTYRYRAFRTNYIQFNPSTSCGGSDVFIQNQATAGLYNYTPYQPNASSLANLYGEGDGCGAYGNRNFWRLYNDWFGTTLSGEHMWRVVRTESDGRLFLQVGNTKRWIPTGDLYNDWGLNQYPTNIISDTTFNAIPTIPELTRLGTDGQYNYVVDNGKRHYLPPQYNALWGYQNTIAAPVSSLLRRIPEIEPMARFIQDSSSNYWLIDGGVRHAIAAGDLAAWGVASPHIVTVQNPYLTYIPISTQVKRNISFSGTSFAVDQGNLVRMPDSAVASAWQADSYVSINAFAGTFMPVRTDGNFLVRASNSSDWYMLSGGNKYYISSVNIARNWGMGAENLVTVSPDFLDQFPLAHVLTNFAEDTSNGMVYVVDGQRHHVSNGSLLGTLTSNAAADVVQFPNSRLNKLPAGDAYTKPLVIIKNTPHLFLLDQGKRYHISTGEKYNAFNAWNGSLPMAGSFVESLPTAAEELTGVFKDSPGNYYLADAGKKTAIGAAVKDAWQSSTNPTFSSDFLSLLPDSAGPIITSRYVKLGDTTHYIDRGVKTRIVPGMLDEYPGADTPASQSNNSTATSANPAAYMIKSSDDQKMWLINGSAKTELSFPQQITLGYLSTRLNPAQASNSFVSTIPNASNSFSLLVRKQNSGGVKFLNFGQALGFPNSDTLLNTAGASNPVIVVDDYTYDSFPIANSLTRIIKDDAGKLYFLENGQRRWITNGNAYRPYASIPITYLYGATMALIPEGPPIN
jgi:hypothetical protein